MGDALLAAVLVASLFALYARPRGIREWQTGFFDHVGDLLDSFAGQPPLVAVADSALVAAILANLMNNWPAALLPSTAIAVIPGQPPVLVAGALIGCTIGANFTMLGSLSTLLWLALARPRGLDVTPAAYARAAFFPTLAALATGHPGGDAPVSRSTRPAGAQPPLGTRRYR